MYEVAVCFKKGAGRRSAPSAERKAQAPGKVRDRYEQLWCEGLCSPKDKGRGDASTLIRALGHDDEPRAFKT